MAPKTKRDSFFHGMITGEFRTIIVIDDDIKIAGLASQIRAALPERGEDYFIDSYAEALHYTESLEFAFTDAVPSEYRAIEDWWGKVQSGAHPGACYRNFAERVPRDQVVAWRRAVRDALTPWTPPHEKMGGEPDEDVNLEKAGDGTATP